MKKIKVLELKNLLTEKSEALHEIAMRDALPILNEISRLKKELDAVNEKHCTTLSIASALDSVSRSIGSKRNTEKRWIYAKENEITLANNYLSGKYDDEFDHYSRYWQIESD